MILDAKEAENEFLIPGKGYRAQHVLSEGEVLLSTHGVTYLQSRLRKCAQHCY